MDINKKTMIGKQITIKPDQNEWLKSNDKSLSKYVQRKIDEDMKKDGSANNDDTK